MGFDLLTLGSQAVLTSQRQLNTTGHNIANVNTEGFSRQSVEQGTNDAQYWSGNEYGAGVHVAAVRRNYDQFAVNELNLSTSALSHASTTDTQLAFLDELMANTGKAIPEGMNEFYNAVSTLADSPNDMGARRVVLEQATLISSSLNDVNGILLQQDLNTKTEISASLGKMNELGKELVEVNCQLIKAQGIDNDLLDRRDRLITELSAFTQVTVTARNNGMVNVMIGSGHTLVSGTQVSELKVIPSNLDNESPQLALVEGKVLKPISHDGIKGKLGALFEYRDKILGETRDQFGRLATGFAMSLNTLQRQGFDLNGQIGSDIYVDFNDVDIAEDRVVKGPASMADLKVFIDDLSQLQDGEYQLRYDGSQYRLFDPNNKELLVSPIGTPPSISVDGLLIQVDQNMAAGELILIRPFRQAAGQMKVMMDEPSQIAAQNYISPTSDLFGTANLTISQQGAQKEFQVTISDNGTQFSVSDLNGNNLLPAQVYPPSAPVTVNGTIFELSAGAEPKDVFSISLIPADGENGNLLLMQALQSEKIMDGGRSSIIDVYESLNTAIGTQKSASRRLLDVTMVENNAAAGRVAEISGVNLDQEAANLMKFQQAYMASSRIMTAADEAFKTLLSVTR